MLDILGSYIVGRALRLPVGLSPPTSLFSATCALIGQRHATIVWLLGYIYTGRMPKERRTEENREEKYGNIELEWQLNLNLTMRGESSVRS